jgi:DNA-binding NtrC family response regulator
MKHTQVADTIAPAPRVLIVDDELPVRVLLARLVKTWGYSYRHCETAAEALEVMETDPADILLCDVTMPEYDGLRLAEQVHLRWPRTAVIMCTGREDSYTVQTSRKAGAIGYVTKPVHPYLLREALDRAMHEA